jgi:hypothetical protein
LAPAIIRRIGRRCGEQTSETSMKSETKADEEFYRKELAAEFARNQVLEQQIERLLAELSKAKAELAALGRQGKPAPAIEVDRVAKPLRPRAETAVPEPARPSSDEPAGPPKARGAFAGGKMSGKSTGGDPPARVKAAPVPAAEEDEKPVKAKRDNRVLVAKLSRSRVTESRSREKPPCRPEEGAEPLFQGSRAFSPTEELAQHAWTVSLQPQPVGTAFRIRFAARAVDVPAVSIRLRYADDVQRTLRFQIDFGKRAIRAAGGKLDVEMEAATVTPLEDGWLLCEFAFAAGRAEPLGFVLVFVDPSKKSPWQTTGRPGQSVLIGAATVSVRAGNGAPSAAGGSADAPTTNPKVRVIRRQTAATEPATSGVLEMSARDREMKPETVGGRAVTAARWQKLAEQRLAHERSFAQSGEFDKILAMKDIYKGKRAFILGNGPSINQQDLTLLRDEITFVANWFINHKRFRRINPKYYCVSSHEMFGGWGKTPDLNADFARLVSEKQTEQTFFFSYRFASYMRELGLVPEPRLRSLIFDRPKFLIDEIGTQNYALNRCMDDGYTVLLTFCVPLCVHFGITDIYLLGCDCDYGLTSPTDPKAYFYRPEQHTSSTTSFDSLVRIWNPGGPIFQTYEIVAREAAARGTRMWNATRGGRLELLPRVDYESLVQG